MKCNTIAPLVFLFAIFSFTGLAIAQDSLAESARQVLEKNKSSLVVVTVQSNLVAETSGEPLPERPQQRRTLGVTIGDDGLIVVSNSAIDASVGLAGQQAKLEEEVVTIRSAKSEFTEIEISYGDTTLLHGKVIRQDTEADVAFIMPDASEAKAMNKEFDFVDFSKFAATAQIGDQVIGLSRASGVYGYMPIMEVGRITGVFKGDRTYFVNEAGSGQGIPVFTAKGKPVGVTVVRIIEGQPSGVLGTLSAGSIQIMANLARQTVK